MSLLLQLPQHLLQQHELPRRLNKCPTLISPAGEFWGLLYKREKGGEDKETYPYILTVPRKARSPNPASTPLKFPLLSEIQSQLQPCAQYLPLLESQACTHQFPALVSTIAATGKRYGWLQHFLRSIMMLSSDTWFPPPREFKASKFRVRIYL